MTQEQLIRDYINKEIKESVVIGEDNRYERILNEANGLDYEWMDRYDFPVMEVEKKKAKFYFAYPEEKIKEMGKHIAESFLHGFISQNRDIANRKRVRLHYQTGMEALVKQVNDELKSHGLMPVIIRPGSMADRSSEIPSLNGIDEEKIVEWYGEAFEYYKNEMKDICGMIGIIEFGQPDNATDMTDSMKLMLGRRMIEDRYVKPGELSFCKVAFPHPEIGKEFEKIFDDVMDMNLENSEEFEIIQQTLIDALDQCQFVRIEGKGENQTNMEVWMKPIVDGKNQTNFMNCGGDLNIPYGEVFTTPKLTGSCGLLHIPDIYLQNTYFHNLKLWFQDGEIVDYSSEYEGKEGKKVVKEKLLNPHDSLPIGEFAIGTNTRAFRICKKYHLESKLPILIYEKMGPHIAVGDPCYRGAEDEAVFNLLDGKEIVAKTNERTEKNVPDTEKYVFKHIDITLPYDEVKTMYGYSESGEKIEFLKDGKFILKGTEKLNDGMKGEE